MDRKRVLIIIGVTILVLALPLTLILVKQRNDVRSRAAAPDQLEAEGGTLGGNAQIKTDSNASGGNYVELGISNNQTPTPSNIVYDAIYTASSSTDQTTALKSFIEANKGKRIALSGIITVKYVIITLPAGSVTTIDWLPGAKLKGIADSSGNFQPVFVLNNTWDLVMNDPHIEGTGYRWDLHNGTAENEEGLGIYGGGRITVNRPNIHDTRGDGIYVGIFNDNQITPVDVILNDVNLYRNSRNAITPNAGELTVIGGKIDQSGLHNVDAEPNTDYAARSIRMTLKNLRLTRASSLAVHDVGGPTITGYAVAGLGYSDAQKQLMDIRGNSSDKFTIAIDRADVAYFMNNSSDVQVTCQAGNCPDSVFIYGMKSLTMSNNTNMIINTTYDIAGPR